MLYDERAKKYESYYTLVRGVKVAGNDFLSESFHCCPMLCFVPFTANVIGRILTLYTHIRFNLHFNLKLISVCVFDYSLLTTILHKCESFLGNI